MIKSSIVALRKESVDRNNAVQIVIVVVHASLSARRAWIEIKAVGSLMGSFRSLSARRAWIEIIGLTYDGLIASVALRKESVDRNSVQPRKTETPGGRSPQGERG